MRAQLSVLAALLFGLTACGGQSSSSSNTASSELDTALTRGAVPSGAPAAAFGDIPQLHSPASWPFEEGAPRTSGTGRYAHGAYYWTDFIYDANGAKGPNVPFYRIGTPTGGSLHYPAANMAGNGADLFVVALGRKNGELFFRVDWQTLIDHSVPVAAFAIDNQEGGSEEWPGITGLRSPGVDALLMLSANGAFIDYKDGSGPQFVAPVTVDMASRSFIAALPQSSLATDQPWTLYVASGINNGEGGFLNDNAGFRSLPNQPPVFNLAFRDYDDEPALFNFWFDESQSTALNTGDVSAFSGEIDWARMGETEPEPLRYGYSNRWYLSSVSGAELGDGNFAAGVDRSEAGVVADPGYYDAVQPYGIYIPSSYSPSSESPSLFTWLLHSFTQNHNQYSASVPNYLLAACENLRQSVCVTPLGRGSAGYYETAAELDFWEVWRDVAAHFNIDSEAVFTTGYSMGAIGSINLMVKYPEVFFGGVILAGSHANANLLPCSLDNNGCVEPKGPELMENLKWNGYYQAHGTFDQLVPFPDARATADGMRDFGYRYVFDHYLVEDHIVWTLKDAGYSAFEKAAQWMVDWQASEGQRRAAPGELVYRWEPDKVNADWGIGPTGAWWLEELEAVAGAEFAEIRAQSGALPEPSISLEPSVGELIFPDATTLSPAVRDSQLWQRGSAEAATGELRASLVQVAALTINLREAGIAERDDKRLVLSSDSPYQLRLTGLDDGQSVEVEGSRWQVRNGELVLSMPAGDSQVVFP
ncbi:hypothetical protein [Spongiibacter marinus]|uniref:hypothetical protein n=1 Tax=Spongiibacter marinus TaxID=354246 RepID=UPI003C3C0920